MAKVEEIPTVESLIARAKELFREKYQRDATVGGMAPGRVNLIGNYSELMRLICILILAIN